MTTNSPFNGGTRSGTLCGVAVVLFVQVTGEELLKTALLAAVGAVASFTVSLGLRTLRRWWKK
jgi:hypothetical protein